MTVTTSSCSVALRVDCCCCCCCCWGWWWWCGCCGCLVTDGMLLNCFVFTDHPECSLQFQESSASLTTRESPARWKIRFAGHPPGYPVRIQRLEVSQPVANQISAHNLGPECTLWPLFIGLGFWLQLGADKVAMGNFVKMNQLSRPAVMFTDTWKLAASFNDPSANILKQSGLQRSQSSRTATQ